MQDYHLYEYAVIRLVPRVERGEFVNIGTIMYCSGQRFLECSFQWDEQRLIALYPGLEIPLVQKYAESFKAICEGGSAGGAIGQLTIAERFRWLTATRSTILQTSAVHPAYCKDAQSTLEKLHQHLVL